MKPAWACLLILVLIAPSARGQVLLGEPPLVPYEGQGPFVILPARFFSAPVYQVGFIAGAALCLPGSLVQNARAKEDVPHDREASIVCGRGLGIGLGWPVYAAVGLPFFLLKSIFWTAPRALFSRPPSGKSRDEL